MKKLMLNLCLLALGTNSAAYTCDRGLHKACGPEEVTIKVSNKGTDDANIVFNVQVSGSNDKDIAKVVDLITTLIEQLNTNSASKPSWASQNPTAALMIASVVSAALTAGIAVAYVSFR